jgi:hypothetical protein
VAVVMPALVFARPAVDGDELARVRKPAVATLTSSQTTVVIDLYTRTPDNTTVVCVDELGPLIPRAYPAQPGWTADGNRVKEQGLAGQELASTVTHRHDQAVFISLAAVTSPPSAADVHP